MVSTKENKKKEVKEASKKTKEEPKELPNIKTGQTIQVHLKVKEGEKERIQVFEGLVIARHGGHGSSATMTVRKVSQGIGVERIFPLHSPKIVKAQIVKEGRTRRSKLYYLRDPRAKQLKEIKAEKKQ
ncbi:50S ribosomal protein L19 [Patescibacteria group bacterium]|nr:50S ribosomal protein L19 [Patescibacteria group bacterium]MBU1890461.1 50S ribosomal protein L19 [Patescibacteria group bacterium]